jgi:pimeloyl-ACP methyl ester carboxylesterase
MGCTASTVASIERRRVGPALDARSIEHQLSHGVLLRAIQDDCPIIAIGGGRVNEEWYRLAERALWQSVGAHPTEGSVDLELMSGAGHAPWMDDPDHVAERVGLFLRSPDPGTILLGQPTDPMTW